MLIQFNFTNYKSFRDETTLDLTATNITEHNKRVYVEDIENGEKLLVSAGIYGANASGKSNLIESLNFMRSYVLNSTFFNENLKKHISSDSSNDNDILLNSIASSSKVEPYRFRKNAYQQDSEFEVYFLDKENHDIYNYGFVLNDGIIEEEWLYIRKSNSNKENEIFHRELNKLKFGKSVEGINKSKQEILKDEISSKTLIVSLGAQLNIPILVTVFKWFADLVILDFTLPNKVLPFPSKLIREYIDGDFNKEDFINFISSFDQTIKDIDIQLHEKSGSDTEYNVTVKTIHEDMDGNEYSLSYFDESSGTHKMIHLYSDIRHSLKNGRTLIIDELSSRLHPALIRGLLHSFLNPEINLNNSQIIFTTHDTWLLELLRRDEIWFVEKDNKTQVSDLYSLVDFRDSNGKKIRKDENIMKNYLVGKYGAVPEIHPIKFN